MTVKLIYQNIVAHKEDFETYNGLIPMELHFFYNVANHLHYLKNTDKKMYKEVSLFYLNCRFSYKTNLPVEYQLDLEEWVNSNQLFSDIII